MASWCHIQSVPQPSKMASWPVQCKKYCILFSMMISSLFGQLMWSCVLATHCSLNFPQHPPVHASQAGDAMKWIDYYGSSQNSIDNSYAWFGGNLYCHERVVSVISSRHSLIFPLGSSPTSQHILNSPAHVEMPPASHHSRVGLEGSRLWIRQSGLWLL